MSNNIDAAESVDAASSPRSRARIIRHHALRVLHERSWSDAEDGEENGVSVKQVQHLRQYTAKGRSSAVVSFCLSEIIKHFDLLVALYLGPVSGPIPGPYTWPYTVRTPVGESSNQKPFSYRDSFKTRLQIFL